jgi:hypothetical protein
VNYSPPHKDKNTQTPKPQQISLKENHYLSKQDATERNQMSISKHFYRMEINHGSSNILDMILSYKQNTAVSEPQ